MSHNELRLIESQSQPNCYSAYQYRHPIATVCPRDITCVYATSADISVRLGVRVARSTAKKQVKLFSTAAHCDETRPVGVPGAVGGAFSQGGMGGRTFYDLVSGVYRAAVPLRA